MTARARDRDREGTAVGFAHFLRRPGCKWPKAGWGWVSGGERVLRAASEAQMSTSSKPCLAQKQGQLHKHLLLGIDVDMCLIPF